MRHSTLLCFVLSLSSIACQPLAPSPSQEASPSPGAGGALPGEEAAIHGVPGIATRHAVVSMMDPRFDVRPRAEDAKEREPDPMPVVNADLPVPEELVRAAVAVKEARARHGGHALGGMNGRRSPPPAVNFSGQGDDGTAIPPDTNGAAGPNHLVTAVNTSVRITDKTGKLLRRVSLDAFWATTGAGLSFDPKVLYDPYGQRWIMTGVADPQDPASAVLMGVSQTTDPLGTWNLYRVVADNQGVDWADYPSIGFNKDWIAIQVNMFPNAGNMLDRTQIFVFDKASAYANGNGKHTLITKSGIGGTQTPALTYDPTLATIYLLSDWNSNANGTGVGFLRLFTLSGAVGAETLTPGPFIANPDGWAFRYSSVDCAPQAGTGLGIDCNDSRMRDLVYRGGTLFATHHVFLPATNPTRASVQWWEVSTAGAIAQLGLLDDPTGATFYAYPSIAVNKDRHVVVGYSRFSTTDYASADYFFRAASDPVGTERSDYVLQAGQGIYYKTFNMGRNRWGDYSNTVVDPTDDSTFWTIQEYAVSGNSWGTWWGKIIPTNPAFDPIPNQTVNENSLLTFTVHATQLNNDPLTYSATNLPAGASFNPATRVFTWTPMTGQAGTYNPVFHVADGALTDAASPLITVNRVDTPPVLTHIPDQMVAELSTLTFKVTASDPDGDTLDYTVDVLPPGSSFDLGTRVFTWTPKQGQAGVYTLNFSVTDGTFTVMQAMKITVIHVNTPPMMAPVPDQNVATGKLLTFTVTAVDGDGDTLTYSASGLPPGATFTAATRTFSWTPTAMQTGVFPVTFSVTDGKLTDMKTCKITVSATAQPPVMAAVADHTVAETMALSFPVSATDPNNKPLTYSASNLPAGSSFVAATRTFAWTPKLGQAGIYFATFTASNGTLTDSKVGKITVTHTNLAPVWTQTPNQTVQAGMTLDFTVLATDPNGDAITYSATNLPMGASFDPARHAFHWPTTKVQKGQYVVTFTASDGMLSASEMVTITVTARADTPPSLMAVQDQTVYVGNLVTYKLSATDPDGDTLTYSASNLPGGATFDPAMHVFQWVPGPSAIGPHTVTFTVSDGTFTDSKSPRITVLALDAGLPPLDAGRPTADLTVAGPADLLVAGNDAASPTADLTPLPAADLTPVASDDGGGSPPTDDATPPPSDDAALPPTDDAALSAADAPISRPDAFAATGDAPLADDALTTGLEVGGKPSTGCGCRVAAASSAGDASAPWLTAAALGFVLFLRRRRKPLR